MKILIEDLKPLKLSPSLQKDRYMIGAKDERQTILNACKEVDIDEMLLNYLPSVSYEQAQRIAKQSFSEFIRSKIKEREGTMSAIKEKQYCIYWIGEMERCFNLATSIAIQRLSDDVILHNPCCDKHAEKCRTWGYEIIPISQEVK